MFKIADFWEIFKAVRDDDSADVSEVLDAIAKSERATSQKFFENKLDQVAYATEDYKRLREFLIDWNAAHRTINTAQRKASTDAFSMTDEALDEMFRSFGYNFSSGILSLETGLNLNKINFLLDLINLYKIKGTPESIVSALEYYGITNIDLIEYFLKKDEKGQIIFEGNKITGSGEAFLDFIERQVSFDEMTGNDPHWMTTLVNLNTLISQNKIGLPTKSPYFSLRSTTLLSEIYKPIAVLSRVVQDQYDEWQSTGNLPTQDASLSLIGDTVSLLELYVSFIYVFNFYYDYGVSGLDDFWCYDGTSFDYAEVTHVVNEYDNYKNYKPTSRADQKQKISEFFDRFTRKRSTHFLQDRYDAATILESLNPTLKNELSLVLDTYPKLDLIGPFVVDIDNWLKTNVDEKFGNLSYYMFGTNSVTGNIDGVINFFKPYRARLRSFDNVLVYNNRLTETIKIDDYMDYNVTEVPTENIIVTDELIKLIIKQYFYITYVCRNENTLGHMMTDVNILDSYISTTSYTDQTSNITVDSWSAENLTLFPFKSPNIKELITYGGFVDFDQPGGFYDCTPANDIINVKVQKENFDTVFPLKTNLIAAESNGEYILTFSRNSSATIIDGYGNIKYTKPNEARFYGARRVENLLDYCDDFAATSWIKTGSITTPDRNTISFTTSDGTNNIIYQTYNFDDVQNRTFSGRIKIPTVSSWDSTSAVLYMTLHDSMDPVVIRPRDDEYVFTLTYINMPYIPIDLPPLITDDGTTITVTEFGYPYDSTSEIHIDTTDQIKFKIWSDSDVTITGIGEAQLEDLTGDPTYVPSEYVSTRKYTYPYHGAGTDGVKYFDFDNRNYIEGNLITWSEQIGKDEAGFGLINSKWFTTDVNVTGDLVEDPNGNLTATEAGFGAFGTSYIGSTVELYENREYTLSFYVKQIDASALNYRVYDTANLTDLVPETSYLSEVSTTEWTRVQVSFITGDAVVGKTMNCEVYLHSGDVAGSVIFWGAQVNAGVEAKTYYKTEENFIDGILIDGKGVKNIFTESTLQGIHVEKTRENLLINANEFYKTGWVKGTNTLVEDNIEYGMDGRLSATRLTNLSGKFQLSQVVPCSPNTQYTFSIYAKDSIGFSDQIRLDIIGTDSTGEIFDLSITGFEKIEVSGTTDSTTSSIEVIMDHPSSAATRRSATICFAQLEVGNHASSYIPTDSTSVIRLSDDVRVSSTDNIENEFSMSYKVTPDKDGTLYDNGEVRFVSTQDTRGILREFRTIGDNSAYSFVRKGGGGHLRLYKTDIEKDIETLYEITLATDGTDVQTVLFVDGAQKLNDIKQFTLDHSNYEIVIGNYDNGTGTNYTYARIKDLYIWNSYYTFGYGTVTPSMSGSDSTSTAEVYLTWD